MRLLLGLVRLIVGLLIVVTAVPAILAIFGGLVPVLDLINHLQLVLFFGTLLALVLALSVRMPRLLAILAFLGFAASAWTFVPEWTSSLAPRPAPTGAPTVRLMTHNMFGLNTDMKRMAAAIAAENPDIVALQEYFPAQQSLDALLRPSYPYSVRCQGGKRANIGLYSKIPFDKEMSDADCPESPGSQRTAHILAGFTLSDGTHFSVLTSHMDWPWPIERQQDELAAIETAVAQVQGPLVVVGDFNSTPWSYAMRGFEHDTGLSRETRNLITFPELFTVPGRLVRGGVLHTWPILPLDQVFERGLRVTELHRGQPTGSDHLPVIFTFEVAKS
ncbi:MAG: endonuclease/exonuclease/phosphatase family protein [Devosia sp.]